MTLLPKCGTQHRSTATTTLRSITRDSPAGESILKELLQNADNAGATSIEFILDLSYHSGKPLLHPDLSRYQGPSLLICSNSIFSFGSRSPHNGDPITAFSHNPTSKYGRRFNSVYNWTDSPSILPGSSFIILDPYLGWSADLGLLFAGDLVYDFVENFGKQEMKNQLAAFEATKQYLGSKFIGTVIRLPLRTKEQALKSEIVDDKFTSPEDILSAFSKFRDGMDGMDGMILFLKEASSITLRVAGEEEIYAKAEMSDKQSVASFKQSIATAFQAVIIDKNIKEFETSLVSIRSCIPGQGKRLLTSKVFHHFRTTFDDGKDELVDWGETQNLVPWVTLAALERAEGCSVGNYLELTARSFTIVPLPIHTNQSLDIHGMFSLTENGQAIQQAPESDMCHGSTWNSKMFEECLAFYWPSLLQGLALNPTSVTLEDGFRYWPRNTSHNRIVGLWKKSELLIWPTCQEWLSANKVFLAGTNEQIESNTKSSNPGVLDTPRALGSVGIPIIYPLGGIYSELKRCFERAAVDVLTPLTAAHLLQAMPEKLENASELVKNTLLIYLLSETESTGYSHLNKIKIFPMCDGSFAASRTLSPSVLILPNTEFESHLFNMWPHMTIDIKKVGVNELAKLREDMEIVQKETSLKQWAIEDIPGYFFTTYFSGLNPSVGADVIEASDIYGSEDNFSESLRGLWDWIILQIAQPKNNEHLLAQLNDLWIIPVLGGRYRRLRPIKGQLVINPSSQAGLGSFLKTMCDAKDNAYETNLLYCSSDLSPGATMFLRKQKIIWDCDDLENLMDWLEYRLDFVSLLCSQERNELSRYLEVLSRNYFKIEISSERWNQLVGKFRRISIFEEIINNSEGVSLNWVSLGKTEFMKYVAVTMENVVPNIDGVVFIHAMNTPSSMLIKRFELAEVPNMPRLLEEYVLPSITVGTVPNIVGRLAVFALNNFLSLSDLNISKMAKMGFVPVSSKPGYGVVFKSLKCPWECVDPEGGLGDLFLAHERVWIDEEFWSTYSKELMRIGLMKATTVGFFLNRVRAYSDNRKRMSIGELLRKVKFLFSLSDQLDIPAFREFEKASWLPARQYGSARDRFVITKPENCRDESYMDLVGYSMPILPLRVSSSWRRALGWNKLIPPEAIKRHLEMVVERGEFIRLGAILDYLGANMSIKGYLDAFREIKWIPGVSGGVFKPEDIYFRDGEKLNPWCDCIDTNLRDKYKPLLRFLGVLEKPSFFKLKQYLNSLGSSPLNSENLDLAINAINLATDLYPKEPYTYFKVPDCTGTLYDLPTLTAGAPQYCETDVLFIHPGISQKVINILGVPSLDQRHLGGVRDVSLGLDLGHFQFPARATVINKLLERYPIESTFSEYLAIAEGLEKVTKVGWLLDRNEDWDKARILTKELSEAMGPSILHWSDGVFSDGDFDELINMGRESKTKNIGRFSCGILTMYHWTSLPHMISGGYFVILDPEGKYLPLSRDKNCRHASMKISLQKMRKNYLDHLKPFYGILGFGPDTDRLEGTIFRFPFRNSRVPSNITPGGYIKAEDALTLMRDYLADAKISLLFLARIKSVEFHIQGSEVTEWEVTVTQDSTSRWITGGVIQQLFVRTRQLSPSQDHSITIDEWRLAYYEVPDTLMPQTIRAKKEFWKLKAKCGIAALVSHHYTHSNTEGRFFMLLPFNELSGLPVHVHAPFILASDRCMISLEGIMEMEYEWNLWILEYGVAELYLHFLEYLAHCFGELALYFWPGHEDLKNPISHKLGKFVWKKAAESDLKLLALSGCGPNGSDLNLAILGGAHERNRRTLCLKEVVFDLLEETQSVFVCILLEKAGIRNIIRPIGNMLKGLQRIDSIEVIKINQLYISSLLRRHAKDSILQKIWAADNYSFRRLGPILEFMFKNSDDLPSTTTGFEIIPLTNQTLGTLEKQGNCSTPQYYISKKGGLDLFDYASGLVVHPDISQEMVNILLKLKLNISILPFTDIPKLFVHLEESEKMTIRFHHFLLKFWVSVRYEYEDDPTYDLTILSNLPVYSAFINGQLSAISPQEFIFLPAIVSPDDEGEAALVLKLSGLYFVDRRTVSSEMQKVEKLSELNGLMRFIEALEKLAKLKHTTPEIYLSSYLELEHIMTLRRLLKHVISKPIVLERILAEYPETMVTLKSLPLWPTMCGKLVSAIDALLAPDPRFCARWVGGQQYLIEPNASLDFSIVLHLMGVKTLGAHKFLNDYGLNIPHRELNSDEMSDYRRFMEASVQYMGNISPCYALALDGNCYLRPSMELYDHTEIIFTSAFHNCLKDYFLHPDFQFLKDTFKPGLKSGISGANYYECATNISKRSRSLISLESQVLLRTDAVNVFECLRQNEGCIIQQWSIEEFERIRGVQFVPVSATNNILHSTRIVRRNRANTTLSPRMFGSLGDCVLPQYKLVCWSQCPIYTRLPGAKILQRIPSKGIPSVKSVLKHIEYLSMYQNEAQGLEEIHVIGEHLVASYKFLNDHYTNPNHASEKVRDIDPRILSTTMWLNIDGPITTISVNLFRTSWTSAKDLYLGMKYNFGHYRFVRSMLAGYEKLLQALEVETVKRPEFNTPGVYHFKSTFQNLYNFYKEGRFCDVELDVDGIVFKAHKAVLASGSSYWERVLIGNWEQIENNKIFIKEIKPCTVLVILNFLYTGRLPPKDTNIPANEDLKLMIGWLVAADQWEILAFKRCIEEVIVLQDHIRPENVRQVLGIARDAQAKALSSFCEEYIKLNRRLLERIV